MRARGGRLGESTALLVRREGATVAAVRIDSQLAPGPDVPYGNLRLVGVGVILVESDAARWRKHPEGGEIQS